jgi:ATP synthase F1 epsilon subunit
MKLQLVGQNGVSLSNEVYEVSLQTSAGRIAIYDLHTPIITEAITGVISLKTSAASDPQEITILGGIVEVTAHSLIILADDISVESSLDEAQIKKAMNDAQEMVSSAVDRTSLEEAKRQLEYSSLKLQLVSKKRRKI